MIHTEALRLEWPRSPALDAPAPWLEPARQPLAELIQALDWAIRTRNERIERVAAAVLADSLADPNLLAGIPCPAASWPYARHLLHGNDCYSLLALVWRPGQMSSVHGHKTWCALGVHRGALTESLFRTRTDGLRLLGCRQHCPGAVSHSPAGSDVIHRLANLGVETAVSIHLYGVPFDRIGEGVNRVWAE